MNSQTGFLHLATPLALLLMLILAACAPLTPAAPAATPTASPAQATAAAPQADPTQALPNPSATLPPKNLNQPTIAPTSVPVVGEVPAKVMAAVLADLEKRTGSQPTGYTLTRGEAITWNDGSLGCPKRGVFYTQSIIEGYWVVLQFNNQTYDYRINGQGPNLLLCEK